MDNWEYVQGDELVPARFETPGELRLSEFCRAAQSGDVAKMQEMLDARLITNVNQASPKKNETALHYACRNGQQNAITFLVDRGADVNICDTRNKNSLHLACSGGFLDAVKYLLAHSARFDIVDKYGRSAMHWAALHGHLDIVKELLSAGAPVSYTLSGNWQPLHEAVKGGDLRIAQLLISHGAEVNVLPKNERSAPYTPLHLAAREGHTDCLKLLLRHKAHVNAANQGKQTPLHEAAFKGADEAVHQLLLHGADPHARNTMGRSPLIEACHQGNLKSAILLLDANSMVNRPDHKEDSAFHHLLQHNQDRLTSEQMASFADVLLQYGANPNLSGSEESTPYMIACSMAEKDVLDVIVSCLEKPRSLLHIAKIACRKIVGVQYDSVENWDIPKHLKTYLRQNTSYFSGW